MIDVTNRTPDAEPGHPLAGRLIEALRGERSDGPVIEVGSGRGRNTRALEAAGVRVMAVDDAVPYTQLPGASRQFAGAIATHAYLHGETAKLRAGLAELARVLAPGAHAFFTLGSITDARFGVGIPFDDDTFAPGDGPEAGIPHAYYDRAGVMDLLRPFETVSLDETPVDEIAGRWAHEGEAVTGRVHWFVHVRKR